MYHVNKIVGAMLNPLAMAMVAILAGSVLASINRKRTGIALVLLALVWLYAWSTPLASRMIGRPLEDAWPFVDAQDAPEADAIVVLGGGMSANTNTVPRVDMDAGADRVWHAARLWRAGKAPIVVPSGCGETDSTVPLLLDFGIPESAILVEGESRNTEENAKFTSSLLSEREPKISKILLVTSAWHMRRSVAMFAKYAPELEIVPAAADYEATVRAGDGFKFTDILPSADALAANSACFKELAGYWGYRLLR